MFEAFGLPRSLLCTPSLESQQSSEPTIASFIHATTFEGKSVKLKKRSRITSLGKRALTTLSGPKFGTLLDIPIHRLLEELSVSPAIEVLNGSDQTQKGEIVDDILWVDRYRPQKFTELIGNDRVAREAMAWVKQWDWCVFGRKKGYKQSREGYDDVWKSDEFHRPREKLLLLSGPPGLGKTTLAHVVARHAGYEVIEINASDARSGAIIDERVLPALESGYTVGSSKPILLVLDEIDGAIGTGDNSSTFIHKLIQLTCDRPRKKSIYLL